MAHKHLASEQFVSRMALLAEHAPESFYLKLDRWVKKSANVLGVSNDDMTLGYADKTSDVVNKLNYPLISKVNKGVGKPTLTSYNADLASLPRVRIDPDFQVMAAMLLRAADTNRLVAEEYPGLTGPWLDFFASLQQPAFVEILGDIEDPLRLSMFVMLCAAATGTYPPDCGLEPADMQYLRDLWLEGSTELLGEALYEQIRNLTDDTPPEPPNQDPEDGDEQDDQDGGECDRDDSKGSGSGGGNDPGESDEQSDEPGETGPSQDPFEQLGSFMQQIEAPSEDPQCVGADEFFEDPELPDNIDPAKMELLDLMGADTILPTYNDSASYLTYKVPEAPDARDLYNAQRGALLKEIRQIRRVIEEHYKIGVVRERALRTGRTDPARLHLAVHDIDTVFRRERQDSVGKAEVIVLLDESSSMTGSPGFTLPLPPIKKQPVSGVGDRLEGRACSPLDNSRVGVAKSMALCLLEASRQLHGFQVRVAGYSDLSNPYEFDVLSNLAKIVYDKATEGGMPVVRELGTTRDPYAIMSTTGMGYNSDYSALHWAESQLRQSRASQKAILYLADGEIQYDNDNLDKMVRKLKQQNVYTYFMSLNPRGLQDRGALSRLPATQIDKFSDMLLGLKRFLSELVRRASR